MQGVNVIQAARAKDPTIPTWSWASIKGRVLFHPELYSGEDLVEMIDSLQNEFVIETRELIP